MWAQDTRNNPDRMDGVSVAAATVIALLLGVIAVLAEPGPALSDIGQTGGYGTKNTGG